MLAFVFLLAMSPPAAAPDQVTPTTDEILRKAVERYAWSDAQKFDRKYVWTSHEIGEEYDSKGKVTKHNDRLVRIVPLTPEIRVGRLLEKDGKPISDAERRAQWDREQKVLAEGRQNQRKPRKHNQEEEDISFNAALVARYNWKLAGTETIQGRPAYILSLEPKSKDLPTPHMIDHVLNKVAGKIWFDAAEFEIVRAEAHLTGDANILGGLAASMRKGDIFFEQTRLDDGAWLMSKMNVAIDARIVVKSIRMHQIVDCRDFLKITPELIAESQHPPGTP